MTADARAQIDELLSSKSRESYSAWHALKREPKKPTNKAVRSYLQHVHWLLTLGDAMPELHLPAVKLKQFTLEARALNVKEISDLKANKRYALAVILIRGQHSKALDDVGELFIRLVRKIENSAQSQLQAYLLQQQKQVDSLIHRFKDLLTAFRMDDSDAARLAAMTDVIGDEADQLIDQCDEHIAYEGNNYLPFMLKPYRQKRALLFNCLKILDLQSTSNDKTTEGLLKLLRSLHTSRHEYLKPEYLQSLIDAEFDPQWMPEKWRKLVLIKEKNSKGFDFLHRKYLELCILSHIKQELSSADLPTTSIIDILTDTEKWLDLHKLFSPLSGNDRRIDEPEKRFITTLFCYGSNLGPSQTAKSIKEISRRQVAWLNLKHASEERLDKAIAQVINAYKKFDLPKYWGTGKHASADGTKWDLYEQNLLSEYHIRYGGYGGIGYYHVSDTYIALFSHFIPCGVYEAVYILT